MNSTILGFVSKECKINDDSNCNGQWEGLGFRVLCSCNCHKKKENARSVVGMIASVTNGDY